MVAAQVVMVCVIVSKTVDVVNWMGLDTGAELLLCALTSDVDVG